MITVSKFSMSALLAAASLLTLFSTAQADAKLDGLVGSQGAVDPATLAERKQPKFIILEDQVHSITGQLDPDSAEHYYGFTSLRGQDVLLAFPEGDPELNKWKVDADVDGRWETQNFQSKVFKNLKAGEHVIIRVSHRDGASANPLPYRMTFGSYPVMKRYELLDEPGVLRIPSGKNQPEWLATQLYKEAVLEVEFSDTKNAALRGGVAALVIKFAEGDPVIRRLVVSGADGRASSKIELGKCYGGQEAAPFEEKTRGFNTWRSWYRPGAYNVVNLTLSNLAPKPHKYYIGHICTQSIQRTLAPRG